MNEIKQKKINNIIDKVLEEEGYEMHGVFDSLTAMTIITDVEDHFDVNLDLNILEGVTERTEIGRASCRERV